MKPMFEVNKDNNNNQIKDDDLIKELNMRVALFKTKLNRKHISFRRLIILIVSLIFFALLIIITYSIVSCINNIKAQRHHLNYELNKLTYQIELDDDLIFEMNTIAQDKESYCKSKSIYNKELLSQYSTIKEEKYDNENRLKNKTKEYENLISEITAIDNAIIAQDQTIITLNESKQTDDRKNNIINKINDALKVKNSKIKEIAKIENQLEDNSSLKNINTANLFLKELLLNDKSEFARKLNELRNKIERMKREGQVLYDEKIQLKEEIHILIEIIKNIQTTITHCIPRCPFETQEKINWEFTRIQSKLIRMMN